MKRRPVLDVPDPVGVLWGDTISRTRFSDGDDGGARTRPGQNTHEFMKNPHVFAARRAVLRQRGNTPNSTLYLVDLLPDVLLHVANEKNGCFGGRNLPGPFPKY